MQTSGGDSRPPPRPPKTDSRQRRQMTASGTLERKKEAKGGKGRGVARRPMFRAEQRTDGDKQRRRSPASVP